MRAANALAAGRLLEENGWANLTCAAHLLQTAVLHVLNSSHLVMALLGASCEPVGHFKHSIRATEELGGKQAQINPGQAILHLVQDVRTRWNSSFYMLQRLFNLQLPVMAVLTCQSKVKEEAADTQGSRMGSC